MTVLDEVEGPTGEHELEQLWHLGSDETGTLLVVEHPSKSSLAWTSPCMGVKEPAPVVCVKLRGELPMRLRAALLPKGCTEGIILPGKICFRNERGVLVTIEV